MKVRPILDRLIVKFDALPTQTESGIILPGQKKWEHPEKTGTVLSVGPGLTSKENGSRIPMTVSEGDRIMFTGTSGMKCEWDDEENVLVITEPDVICILK